MATSDVRQDNVEAAVAIDSNARDSAVAPVSVVLDPSSGVLAHVKRTIFPRTLVLVLRALPVWQGREVTIVQTEGGLDECSRTRCVSNVPYIGLDRAHSDALAGGRRGGGKPLLVVLLVLLVVGNTTNITAKGLRELF
jgi:hypothetical protein